MRRDNLEVQNKIISRKYLRFAIFEGVSGGPGRRAVASCFKFSNQYPSHETGVSYVD